MSVENFNTPVTRTTPRWVIPTAIGVVSLFIGVLIGASGSSADASGVATPAPAVTVTSKPVETVKEVTKEVEVAKVPQACLDALNDADALQQISGEMANEVATHLQADGRLFNQFAEFDFENTQWYLDGQNAFNASIGSLTDRVTSNTYGTNAAACRAA